MYAGRTRSRLADRRSNGIRSSRKSENCIEEKKDRRGADNEGGPRSGHAAMAKVGPKIEAETLGNDSAAAKPDDTGSRCPFAVAVETSFSSLSQSPLPGQGAIDHLGYP